MPPPEETKAHNESVLAQLGLEINPGLPCVEAPEELKQRSASDVVHMFLALSWMVRVGHGYPIAQAKAQLEQQGLMHILGSEALAILNSGTATVQQNINLTWQVEGAQALAWALDLADLDHTLGCDDDVAQVMHSGTDVMGSLENAQLRPVAELQQQVDLIYRMHWYAVNCRFTGQACKLNESIIRERRRALDWMYGVEQDWDAVPLDT